MAQVSKERVEELQKIIEKDHDKKLTDAEASEAANNLVGFFSLLLKVDRRINPQRYKKPEKKDDSLPQ
jgi:hypothetical protein